MHFKCLGTKLGGECLDAGEGLWYLFNGFDSSLLFLYVGLNQDGGCGCGMQHAVGKTRYAYILLEMYVLKMCTVSS
jgi:hypothetical protein